MPEVSLSTFPDSPIEALALLYVQNQKLAGKTPEEICEIYWDAYYRIYNHNRDARNSAKINNK